MKKILVITTAALCTTLAFADVSVTRKGMGLGTPGTKFANAGVENAVVVNTSPDVLFVPQYLPGHPTAATIWPRTVEVPCTEGVGGVLECEGFHWTPALGRGEYLFITPVVSTPVPPVVVEKIIEKKVLVEVPVKKKPE